ncbi:MAG TPA: hypothetical protein VFQ85_14840 [Mycobacteriales bacterium]|jgi:hypothetical protein|nr:hypothetical protein [Mycobacteriales bacterium]
MKRSLTLKRETLAELATSDLIRIAGAGGRITVDGITCPGLLGCVDATRSCAQTCDCCTATASC